MLLGIYLNRDLKKMKRFIFLFCLALGACQTSLDLPEPIQHDDVETVSPYTEKKAIQFAKVGFDIPTGELYAVYPFWRWSFPNVSIGLWSCNYNSKYRYNRSKDYWKSGKISLNRWQAEISEAVETPLIEQGYDIVSTKEEAFENISAKMRTQIALAATITDLKMNICHLYNGYYKTSVGLAGGSAYIKVKWELYDTLRKKSLGIIENEAIGQIDDPASGGVQLLIIDALRNAATDLGRTQKFYNLATKGADEDEYDEDEEIFPLLTIETNAKPLKKPIKETFNFVRRAALTIRTSSGHGSGFYINNEGYALTNYHVVGDAKSVAVTDFSGTSHMADVIRVHKTRDVALIKVNVFDNPVMSLKTKGSVKMMDKVYALGTPLHESQKLTVTEGIVSNFRTPRKTSMSYIQASVPLAGGNSGGALLDEFGNVVGIAFAIVGDPHIGSNYSRFIPIKDALDKLNIKMVKPY